MKKEDDKKLFAFLAVFLSIVGFIIALVAKKEDKYVMFYAKESLVLFIFAVILQAGVKIITVISFGLLTVLSYAVMLVVLIFWVIQIVYSLSGEMKSTPVIGQFTEKIKL